VAEANARIVRALERPMPMRFPDPTKLDHVLKYIQDATRGQDGKGIPIYVNPASLKMLEETRPSTVSIDLDSVTLMTGLRLCLQQLELKCDVRDGLLQITWEGAQLPVNDDPVLIVGQCLLALIAAGLGGVLAPFVSDLRRGPPG
jgi:hypothetical protein